MVSQPTCKTCIHWHKEGSGVDGEYGECRRYPRSNITIKNILAHEWCGEHPEMLQRFNVIIGADDNIYRIDADKNTGFVDVSKVPK